MESVRPLVPTPATRSGINIWRHFFELDPSWPVTAQIRTLEAQLAQIDPTFPHRLPLLGAAVNLPIPDNELTAAFDAKLRKSSLEALLVDCLRAKSQHGPILIVLGGLPLARPALSRPAGRRWQGHRRPSRPGASGLSVTPTAIPAASRASARWRTTLALTWPTSRRKRRAN